MQGPQGGSRSDRLPRDPLDKARRRRQQGERHETISRDRRDRRRAKVLGGMPSPGPLVVRTAQVEGRPWRPWRLVKNGR